MDEWHDADYVIVDRIYEGGYMTLGASEMLTHEGVIKCPDFFSDHFLGFLDKELKKGTAVHLIPRMEPGRVLDGWVERGVLYGDYPPFYVSRLDPISEVYEDPDDVSVLHIFHKNMNLGSNPLFSVKAIEDVLGARGFGNVRHVPLYEERGHDEMVVGRDIVLDTGGGCVYVFPKEKNCYLKIPFF